MTLRFAVINTTVLTRNNLMLLLAAPMRKALCCFPPFGLGSCFQISMQCHCPMLQYLSVGIALPTTLSINYYMSSPLGLAPAAALTLSH